MSKKNSRNPKQPAPSDNDEVTFVTLFPEIFGGGPDIPPFKRPRRPRSRPLTFEETIEAFFVEKPKPEDTES
jgi:hypothetical protein